MGSFRLAYDVGWDYSGDGGYENAVLSVDTLQRDIEVRFTGEYDENNFITFDPGDGSESQYILRTRCRWNCIGGSYAWISGARNYDLAIHPDPGNVDKDGFHLEFGFHLKFGIWNIQMVPAN